MDASCGALLATYSFCYYCCTHVVFYFVVFFLRTSTVEPRGCAASLSLFVPLSLFRKPQYARNNKIQQTLRQYFYLSLAYSLSRTYVQRTLVEYYSCTSIDSRFSCEFHINFILDIITLDLLSRNSAFSWTLIN